MSRTVLLNDPTALPPGYQERPMAQSSEHSGNQHTLIAIKMFLPASNRLSAS
jgi:hypothetical protein